MQPSRATIPDARQGGQMNSDDQALRGQATKPGTAFDPFQDRLCRDIRNQLSEAIIACLRTRCLEPAQQVAQRFLAMQLASHQLAYIEQRLGGYARFLERVATGPEDVLWQGLLLWDLGLHFEVHELLEQAWHRARGEEKLLLQAMIRAAGVYIKGEYGYTGAAAKLAAKALPVLESQRQRLASYIDPERLCAAMRNPTAPAPLLLGGAILRQPRSHG